jgi:crotonobetaine/carnitine-CoA ligase
VAVNTEFRGAGLARVLNLSPYAVFITADEFVDRLEPIVGELTPPKILIAVGNAERFAELAWSGSPVLAFADLVESANDTDSAVSVSDSDVGMVVFTSGTTGPSKGCMVPHRCMVRAAESIVEALELTNCDTFYTAYPLFHTRAAVLDVLSTLLVGGRVVVAPRFSASRFWADMREYEVTVFSIIGTVMQILWKQPPSTADRDHKVRITWGGPITVEPADFKRRFGVEVLPGKGCFGMSETGMVSITSADPSKSGRVRSIFEVRIADDNDDPVGKNQVGEILVRSTEPSVMFSGYLGMPEATIAAWRNLWFHTGDSGFLDSEGRLVFLGRKRDTIRRAGHNISCWEVEEVVDRHPSVLECTVIGVPSELGEEEIQAFVVLRSGASLSEDELLDYCRHGMAAFMVPQKVRFVDTIPKTETGKAAKAVLLAQFSKRTVA